MPGEPKNKKLKEEAQNTKKQDSDNRLNESTDTGPSTSQSTVSYTPIVTHGNSPKSPTLCPSADLAEETRVRNLRKIFISVKYSMVIICCFFFFRRLR